MIEVSLFQTTDVRYSKMIDHDFLSVTLKNLQLFDNTNYPNTLNPEVIYALDAPIVNNEIIGLNR